MAKNPIIDQLQPLSVDLRRAGILKHVIQDFANPKHVFGLGAFGGNLSLVKYLAGSGHQVILWEQKREDQLKQSWDALADYHDNIEIHWEAEQPEVDWKDWVFTSPAFSPYHPWIKDHPVDQLSSEIELSLHLLADRHSRVHVILGSVGKSTCASLLSHALQCPLYGNIGRSPLKHIFFMNQELILELSSFQLHYLRSLKFIPSSYFVTPIADNHAQWHGGLKEYQKAKLEWVEAWKDKIPGTDMNHEEIPNHVSELNLLGPHNLTNANAVLKHIDKIRSSTIGIQEQIQQFKGLHHRLELVYQKSQGRVINDSKATSPAATLNALKCIQKGSTLILQGDPVSSDYMPIWKSAQALQLKIVLISGMRQHEDLLTTMKELEVLSFDSLEDAFHHEAIQLESQKDILFSPGAPSYDQYLNFEVRGDAFKELVKKYITK